MDSVSNGLRKKVSMTFGPNHGSVSDPLGYTGFVQFALRIHYFVHVNTYLA